MSKKGKASDTDAASETIEAMVACVVASPLKYDGQRHDEGAAVTLPQALYDQLKAAGVVNPPDPAAAQAEEPAQ